MLVKPRKPDMVIRDPRTYVKLPAEGKRVPEISYWVRRLGCGDVVKTTAEDIAKGKAERLAKANPQEEPVVPAPAHSSKRKSSKGGA